MKITIELPDDLHKALKSDFAAQVISEKFLGLELSASSKVAHLVLQAAQQSVQPDVANAVPVGCCDHGFDIYCPVCAANSPRR